MNLLSVKNLSKKGREAPLFYGVTFGLDEGDKAALIGKNGTGKSTLLNCIAGNIAPDEGTAVMNREAGVSFLPQNPPFNPEATIREHIFCSEAAQASRRLAVIREYETVCAEMAGYADTALPGSLQKKFDALCTELTDRDLWNYEASIRSVLTTLHITDLDRQMKTLSGGMLKKVALAQVLVEDTRILLLDEPTNHLDITTIAWLEEYLRTTDRAVLMVTHDRYFLDSVCNNIYELEHGNCNHYTGNFSVYLEKKATELEIAQNTERRIESVLRTEREWLMRGPCARGTKAKARIDNISRLMNRDKPVHDKEFAFEVAGKRLGGKILEIEHVSKSYPKAGSSGQPGREPVPVIRDFSYVFNKGEKVGIFGENGTGKTTLLNIITGNLEPDSGTVTRGENTVFGYYQQNPNFGNTEQTVLDYIKEQAEYLTMNNGKSLSAALLLEEFGFAGKIQYSPVTALSGGERKRLFLVRLLMGNPNFLVLDEPTNDFDIFTMSVLESFLAGFSGCLLVVSHDRCFMDKTAGTLLILEPDGSVSGYTGSCSEYIEYRKQTAAQHQQKTAAAEKPHGTSGNNTTGNTAVPENAPETPQKQPDKPRRRTFKEQKEFDSIEQSIFDMEARKEELETLLSGTAAHEKMAELSREYAALAPQLEEKYARWEELGNLTEY